MQRRQNLGRIHTSRSACVCPICCVVPPHMLEQIMRHGNERQRTWAFETLRSSEQFRGRRQTVGNVTFMVQPGEKRRTVFDAQQSETLPGRLVRSEGQPPTGDRAADEAYDGAGATY